MRLMDSVRTRIVIHVYRDQFASTEYRDETGRVPTFRSCEEAGRFIREHNLPIGSSAVEQHIGRISP